MDQQWFSVRQLTMLLWMGTGILSVSGSKIYWASPDHFANSQAQGKEVLGCLRPRPKPKPFLKWCYRQNKKAGQLLKKSFSLLRFPLKLCCSWTSQQLAISSSVFLAVVFLVSVQCASNIHAAAWHPLRVPRSCLIPSEIWMNSYLMTQGFLAE